MMARIGSRLRLVQRSLAQPESCAAANVLAARCERGVGLRGGAVESAAMDPVEDAEGAGAEASGSQVVIDIESGDDEDHPICLSDDE